MRDDERDDWTPEEREQLGNMSRDREPPPQLEDRVVADLRSRGMVSPRTDRRKVAAMAAVLAVLVPAAYLFGVRVGAGQTADARPVSTGATFALMVLDPVRDGEMPAEQVAAAVEEASRWAAELAEDGTLVAAEKLRDDGARLVRQGGEVRLVADFPSAADALVLGGFFLIRATDYEEAQRIAAECPLLRYGSTIEVRAFEEI